MPFSPLSSLLSPFLRCRSEAGTGTRHGVRALFLLFSPVAYTRQSTEKVIMAEEKSSGVASAVVAIVGIIAIIILVYFVFLKGGDGDTDINVKVDGVEDVLPENTN